MPRGAELRVVGYEQLVLALRVADRDTKKFGRDALKSVGDDVKQTAASIVAPKSASSAAGFRVAIRQKGVAVQQGRRKTTGVHPEWGSWQMRHALIPAVYINEDNTMRKMEEAMDRMAARFNAGGL